VAAAVAEPAPIAAPPSRQVEPPTQTLTRPTTVVVQPMPAAAAAAIAQLALGRAPAGPEAFHLDSSATTEFSDVPLLPDEERTVPVAPEVGGEGSAQSNAMLTTEMAPRFSATTAFSTSEMAPNFMSTTAMADATDADPVEAPAELVPDFDVHQGAATTEMAPNFAGTTAFGLPEEAPPTDPDMRMPKFDIGDDGMATSEMAPHYAGTTPFNPSDLVAPEMPSTGASPATPSAVAAPDFASTVAFDAAELAALADAPVPPRTVLAPGPDFDPDKTMILSGGFDSASEKDAAFTEELYPPVAPAPVAPMRSGTLRTREKPPEDFDKTVEISGGFESQPVEEEAPLDDLFPPIKF
jgi:hypothetical protein